MKCSFLAGFSYKRQKVEPAGPKIGSAPEPSKDLALKEEHDELREGTTLARQIGTCNELESEINKERGRNGLRALKCDHNMRWVANKHVDNQLEAGFTGFEVRL